MAWPTRSHGCFSDLHFIYTKFRNDYNFNVPQENNDEANNTNEEIERKELSQT